MIHTKSSVSYYSVEQEVPNTQWCLKYTPLAAIGETVIYFK